MNTGYKMTMAFIALLMIVGISASATRASRSALAHKADSANIKQQAAADSQKINEGSVVDEVIWVVGDEAILKSDVEVTRLQAEAEGIKYTGDPDCSIPEQIAVQKLFLHQAAIDSIEVSESEVMNGIDEQINSWVSMIGSREKLEEYRKQSITQMRQQMHDDFKNQLLIQKMKQELVKDIKVSPAQVRKYFKDLPADSIPFVPTEVEVEILTMQPRIPLEEINRVKNQLREFTDRVNKGETSFATLARLYSEDPGSARMGGEMDYIGRGMLDPAFANVAFNLTDPKKISKIVESEFGYHIIQLIDRRGDKIKFRHILRRPTPAQADIDSALVQLDSIANEIRKNVFSFEEAAAVISEDNDTRNNFGVMTNVRLSPDGSDYERTPRFRMQELPPEIAKAVAQLNIGEISAPFTMMTSKGQEACVIVKLRNRVKAHRATLTEDFQVLKAVVLEKKRQDIIQKWIREKQKTTYVRINPEWSDCDFQYPGWGK